MSEDYILRYSNALNNKTGNIEQDELKIDGECKITDYDPREEKGFKQGQITIDFTKDAQTIDVGNDRTSVTTHRADFEAHKYSIFREIAALDDNDDELSMSDIKKIDKVADAAKWGLQNIKLDFRNGVATLIWSENDILRIDFQTWRETIFGKQDASFKKADANSAQAETEMLINPDIADVEDTQLNKKDSLSLMLNELLKIPDNPEVAEKIKQFSGGNIDINDVYDLESVAEYTGISMDYIKDVLVGLEGKSSLPICETYDDKIKGKAAKKGQLTIGFGHTSLTGEPKVTPGMQISVKQAYQILANDIITAHKGVKTKLKGLYEKTPNSIINAAIDIAFNKGPDDINASFIANLREGYYHSAARRTWYDTPVVGLQKRNMYRFISAISGLDKNQKINAIKRFKQDHQDQLLRVFKKDTTSQKVWNEMCNEISYNDGRF